jgi:protein-S-isoprenylcysteine O-methyltransferase Ste14
MAIWWGLALFGFAATGAPWVVVGAVSITIMFFAVSIPLKEARMRARRADYADYARRVPLILPLKLR